MYMKVIMSRSRLQKIKVENPHSRNVKLRSAITPILEENRDKKFACSMGILLRRRIERCDRHLCHVTGSDRA